MHTLDDAVTTAYRTGTYTPPIARPRPVEWPSAPPDDAESSFPEAVHHRSRPHARRFIVIALTAVAVVCACLTPMSSLRGRALASVSMVAEHSVKPAVDARLYYDYLAPIAAQTVTSPVRAVVARHEAITDELAHWLFINLPSGT